MKYHTFVDQKSTHSFLDSKELHQWVYELLPQISQSALSQHEFPVIMIDLESNRFYSGKTVLFDRIHQAAAFKDMVVGLISSGLQG